MLFAKKKSFHSFLVVQSSQYNQKVNSISYKLNFYVRTLFTPTGIITSCRLAHCATRCQGNSHLKRKLLYTVSQWLISSLIRKENSTHTWVCRLTMSASISLLDSLRSLISLLSCLMSSSLSKTEKACSELGNNGSHTHTHTFYIVMF